MKDCGSRPFFHLYPLQKNRPRHKELFIRIDGGKPSLKGNNKKRTDSLEE